MLNILIHVIHCLRPLSTEIQTVQSTFVHIFDGIFKAWPNRETVLNEYAIGNGDPLQRLILVLIWIIEWSVWQWTANIIPKCWTFMRWIWEISTNVLQQQTKFFVRFPRILLQIQV